MSDISVPTMPYVPDSPGSYGLITLPVFTCDLSLTAGAAYIARPSISLATLNNRKLTLTAGGKTLIGWGGGVTTGADVTMTAAGSGSSGITVADNANIDFGTENFTLYFDGLVPDFTPAAALILMQKWATNVGYELGITATTGTIYLKLNTTTYTSSAAPAAVDGTKHKIAAVVTVGAVNTTVDFYFDGVALGTQQTAANPGTVSNAASLYILGTSAVRTAGTVSDSGTFNRALTATEVLNLYRNGIVFADKWGSQTALTSGTLTVGKKYRINTYVSNDDFANVGAASNASGVEFVATGTTPTHWDHLSSLVLLGATLALEPEGINAVNWLDSSTNDLDASYPAAGSSITSTGTEVFKIVSAQGGVTRDWTSDDGINVDAASFVLTVTAT
jgi:hypothetical protein